MDPAERVVVEDGTGRFAQMLGGLLTANLVADPDKVGVVRRANGTVGFIVTDSDEEAVLHLTGELARISAGPAATADLRLVGTADTILGLSTVPLRFGLPDLLTSTGRGMTGRWVAGGLQVHGLPRAAPLLRTVLSLITVMR